MLQAAANSVGFDGRNPGKNGRRQIGWTLQVVTLAGMGG